MEAALLKKHTQTFFYPKLPLGERAKPEKLPSQEGNEQKLSQSQVS